MTDWPDLLLIDKPHGITSFDVIRRLRRIYSDSHAGERAPKFGHAGTLDPLATGLMLIGVGGGTKMLSELIKLDKEYIAEVRLGESRTTGDMEGDVIDSYDVTATEMEIRQGVSSVLTGFARTHTLPVSAYSAIKVDGIPMYKRARQAEITNETIINIPMRQMTVHEAELLHVEADDNRMVATIRFRVASGTYIRSLAEELGRNMGYPACLQNLRRTKVGQYDIDDAHQLNSL